MKATKPVVVVSRSATMPETVPPLQEAVLTIGIEGCDRELKALKRLDAQRYARLRAQFTRLMSGASVYAGIRADVASGTREAVDAMYRYRTEKLCSEISQDVLDALARQGDSVADDHN
ncbi:TPA: hypothetical protein ACIBQR_002730 [Salmonella enterica subsp. enterica serovar Chester]